MRPFGITTLLAGFDGDEPQLYRTRPAGTHTAWKAIATGRGATTLRQYLEKNYQDDMSPDDGIELTVKTLLELVESGAKNIEICVMRPRKSMEILETAAVEAIVARIERE